MRNPIASGPKNAKPNFKNAKPISKTAKPNSKIAKPNSKNAKPNRLGPQKCETQSPRAQKCETQSPRAPAPEWVNYLVYMGLPIELFFRLQKSGVGWAELRPGRMRDSKANYSRESKETKQQGRQKKGTTPRGRAKTPRKGNVLRPARRRNQTQTQTQRETQDKHKKQREQGNQTAREQKI